MKILYLSCHSVLEHDEIKLFHELGHEVFSMGAYANPKSRGLPRPDLPQIKFHPNLHSTYMQCSKENIHPELIDWANVVVMMHNSRVDTSDHAQPWLSMGDNWARLKTKPVIWRSIGQSTQQVEQALAPFRADGLRVVRYSPKEANIPAYVGADAVIRFYKSEEEFKDWVGQKRQVITFAQSFKQRGSHLHFNAWEQATDGFQRLVYGPGNEELGDNWGGNLPYPELKKQLRANAVYFYTGTAPASYTLGFMEAWMTGIPIVAIGPKIANSIYQMETYEVHELIQNGVNGFCSDDIGELRGYIKQLLDDEALAKRISQSGRESAIRTFGKFVIARQWQDYFSTLVGA